MHNILRLRVYGCHNLWKIIRLSMHGKNCWTARHVFQQLFHECVYNNIIIIILIIISQLLISLIPPVNSS